jgi:integrase
MTWAELDLERRTWTLGPERTKNRRPHVVPLSDQALAIIQQQTRFETTDCVFSTTGCGPYCCHAETKALLDAHMKLAKPWVVHDLRRTAATGMADIGVQPHVIEAVLNHASGHKSGVAGIYNRSAYAKDKAEALQRWADEVDAIVAGEPGKIVAFRPATEGA